LGEVFGAGDRTRLWKPLIGKDARTEAEGGKGLKFGKGGKDVDLKMGALSSGGRLAADHSQRGKGNRTAEKGEKTKKKGRVKNEVGKCWKK